MTCFLENEYGASFDFDLQKVFEQAVSAVLSYLDCPYETTVNLLLVDDEAIRVINSAARGIDAPTDVLSFPVSDYEHPGDFSSLEENADAFDPDTGELLLGDIVISVDHLLKNAEDYGHSDKREYAFLIVHSMLHLTGFDHMEERDRIPMEEAQKQIMAALGINR